MYTVIFLAPPWIIQMPFFPSIHINNMNHRDCYRFIDSKKFVIRSEMHKRWLKLKNGEKKAAVILSHVRRVDQRVCSVKKIFRNRYRTPVTSVKRKRETPMYSFLYCSTYVLFLVGQKLRWLLSYRWHNT